MIFMALLKNQKPEAVKKLAEMINKYNSIGIVNLHKMPAKQLQKIRHALKGKAEIKISRKTLIKKAIESSNKKDISKLIELIGGNEPGIIFTNDNPFKIFKFLKENKTQATAKSGDIAPKDIIISKGPTSIPPGPAISAFQAAGLKTTVEGGKIAVAADKCVLKKGEKVTKELANIFSLLKLEPMEIGLDISGIYESGIIYRKDVLDIDEEQYKNDLMVAINAAINLSLECGYLTKETVKIAIRKAFNEAKSLAALGIIEKEFIDDIIAKANIEARMLEEITKTA